MLLQALNLPSGKTVSYRVENVSITGSGCTVNIAQTAGVVTNVTLNAGGSAYPNNSTLRLLVTGGGGTNCYFSATSNGSGVITAVTATPITGGTGYSTTTGATTSISIVQDWTSTGVTESLVDATAAKSIYYVNTSLIYSDSEYLVKWKTNDATPYTASEGINLINSTLLYTYGTVTADAGNSTTLFKTNLTFPDANFIVNSWILFTTGALRDQTQRLYSYTVTNGVITVSNPFTQIPAGGDIFRITNK